MVWIDTLLHPLPLFLRLIPCSRLLGYHVIHILFFLEAKDSERGEDRESESGRWMERRRGGGPERVRSKVSPSYRLENSPSFRGKRASKSQTLRARPSAPATVADPPPPIDSEANRALQVPFCLYHDCEGTFVIGLGRGAKGGRMSLA